MYQKIASKHGGLVAAGLAIIVELADLVIWAWIPIKAGLFEAIIIIVVVTVSEPD